MTNKKKNAKTQINKEEGRFQQFGQSPVAELVASIKTLMQGKVSLDHYEAPDEEVVIRTTPTGYLLTVQTAPVEGQ